jgi:hypothetical protein
MLFETLKFEEGWDGKYNGEYCETGVYAYVITYNDTGNPEEVIQVKGNVTLFR